MAELEQELGLRIDSALQAVAQLDRALTEAATSAGEALGDRLATAVQSVDATPITGEITEAVESADTAVTVEDVDAAIVTEAIGESVTAADTDVEVGDVAAEVVTETISAAVAGADTSVSVDDVDASSVGEAIEQAVASADTTVDIEAPSADAPGGANFATNILAGKEATDLLSASTGALQGSFGGLAAKAGPAGLAVAGVAGAIGLFFGEAAEARDVTERFNATLGESAQQIEQVDIGGLNIQLGDLAIQLGASDDALRQVATDIGILGQTSGASADQIATTAEEVLALAANVAAVHPELGTMDQIAGSLTNALARGGRATRQFGIDLDSADVKARAATIALADGRSEISQFDLVAAGAALSTAQLGDSIGENVERGSKQVGTSMRSLRTAISETIEELGGPLIDPVVGLFRAAAPAIGGLARVIGVALQALTPVLGGVATAFEILSPVIGAVATALEFLAPALKIIVPILIAMTGPIGLVIAGFTLINSIFGKTKDEAKGVDAAAGDLDATLGGMTESLGPTVEGVDRLATSVEGMGKAIVPVPELVRSLAETVEINVPGIGAAFEKASEDSQVSLMELQVALQDQIVAERQFFANLSYIIAAGGSAIAEELAAQGPERGAAAAKAIAGSTPIQVAALNAQAEELKTLEFERGREISTRLAEGFAVGIQKALGSIKASVNQLKSVVDTAFQIRSPSRWARGRGQLIAQGLALGIEAALPRVASAFGQLDRFTVGGSSGSVNVTSGAPAVGGAPVTQNITVVAAQDPDATAQRVSMRVLQGAQR